jgi:hypothetical protein
MLGYTFKTYIANGREYFEFGENEIGETTLTKKDCPFPDSLMTMLYFDIWALEPLFKQIDHALRYLHETKNAQDILPLLDELAEQHVYFELVRLEWRYRLQKAEQDHFEEWLPRKRLSHIPSTIDMMQRQIKTLFDKVLDMDKDQKHSISEKMARYYSACGRDTLNTFQFQPQPMNFELIDGSTFGEVLYPKDIYDLIDHCLRECIRREQPIRVCKNCGRYFALTGHLGVEYCSRPFDEKGRTCKDVGAINLWTQKRSDDQVFKAYRREYKKRFAWIKAGKIVPEDFYAWSERARAKKVDCDAGRISLEEYQEWLRDS